jgi:hypothetical protein
MNEATFLPVYIESARLQDTLWLASEGEQASKIEKTGRACYLPEEVRFLLDYTRGGAENVINDYLKKIHLIKKFFPGARITTSQLSGCDAAKFGKEKETIMHMNDLFPSKFLSKDDLGDPKVFTIESVVKELVQTEEGKSEKAVVYFGEDTKPFILNKTNGEILFSELGGDTDEWEGRKVELFVDPNVRFGTKKTGGIRVRVPAESPF